MGDEGFGALLRAYRRRARLSQEELAARAFVSTRAISDLERGVNARPRLHTATALADGLGLEGDDRARFEAYARPDTGTGSDAAAARPGFGVPPGARPPHSVDAFVDDGASLRELLQLVRDHRLVSVIGPGGAGKTRLATELAHRIEADGPVAYVALASLADPGLVLFTIADALGAEHGPSRSDLQSLTEHLGSHELTLVLDNLEQVVESAGDLAALLRACAGVRLVVTTRVPLHVAGEVRFAARPLDADVAMRLFHLRAVAAGGSTAVTRTPPEILAELCARLDGLPLAIELAAARSSVLTPADMLGHLDQVLDLLHLGRGDAAEHHRSMRAALEWSYRLLPPSAQAAFAALGAFATSASTDAAAAVWGLRPGTPAFFDVVQTLAEAHLVVVAPGEDTEPPRLDLFEISRQFAHEKLEQSGDTELVYRRLTEHVLTVVDRAERDLWTTDAPACMRRLDRELPNLRVAGRWLLSRDEPGAADTHLRLLTSLQRYWDIRSRWVEAASWLRDALAQPGASANARATARKTLAVMLRCLGEADAADAELVEAIAMLEHTGDRATLASCINNQAVIALDRAEYDRAAALLQRALTMCEELGGEEHLAAVVLNNLGLATIGAGRLREALRICRRGRTLLLTQGNMHGLCWVEDNIGMVLTLSGHPAWAVPMHHTTVRRRLDLGDASGLAYSLEALAEAWTGCGETALAGLALGFVDAHRRRLGALPVPMSTAMTARRRATLVARVGEQRAGELWEEGAGLAPDLVREWFST